MEFIHKNECKCFFSSVKRLRGWEEKWGVSVVVVMGGEEEVNQGVGFWF